FFSSRRRHTRFSRDWSSDVCSSDLVAEPLRFADIQRRQVDVFGRILAAWPSTHFSYPPCASRQDPTSAPAPARCRGCRRAFSARSEERRVGKEYRSEGTTVHEKKKE